MTTAFTDATGGCILSRSVVIGRRIAAAALALQVATPRTRAVAMARADRIAVSLLLACGDQPRQPPPSRPRREEVHRQPQGADDPQEVQISALAAH